MAEQNFKTSFIPSKPIQPVKKGGNLSVGAKGNVLTIISTLIFLSTLVVAAGVFIHRTSLVKTVDKQIEEINNFRTYLDSQEMKDAERLFTRIESVAKILENHVAPSQIFEILEKHTLKSLKFDDLSYVKAEDGISAITIKGEAQSYGTIALQSDSYSKTGLLRNIIFTGLQPNLERGSRTYNLDMIGDRNLILYSERIKKAAESAGSFDDQ